MAKKKALTADDFPHKRIGKIERTFLGYEDHGILTAWLHFTFGPSAQGFGGYFLDEQIGRTGDGDTFRRGTAAGMDFVARCLGAAGVDGWEKLKGRTLFVLYATDGWNERPIGIAPLPTEPGVIFLIEDWQKAFHHEAA